MNQQLKNLIETSKAAIEELVRTGILLADNSEERLNTCSECECFDNGWCSQTKCKETGCGCWMPVKTKVAVATCPKNKWK